MLRFFAFFVHRVWLVFFLTLFYLTDPSFFFFPHDVACGILVPRPGIELVLPAMEAQSPDHWTARNWSLLNGCLLSDLNFCPYIQNQAAFLR